MKTRKFTTYLLLASMTATMLAGCGKTTTDTTIELTMAPTSSETTMPTETTPETSTFTTYTLEEYKSAGVNELNSVPELDYFLLIHKISPFLYEHTLRYSGHVYALY